MCSGWVGLPLFGLSFTLLISGPPAAQFAGVARSAGITFSHENGSRGISTILAEAGPGVCVADLDGDGCPSIYSFNNAFYRRTLKTSEVG